MAYSGPQDGSLAKDSALDGSHASATCREKPPRAPNGTAAARSSKKPAQMEGFFLPLNPGEAITTM
jgi:hypothetical protein